MKILGINFGHDAAATYLENGVVKLSIEEEKISRVKQDFGWPAQAIAHIQNDLKINPADIDVIAFGSQFYNELGKNEILYRFSKKRSDKNKEIIDRITSYLNLTAKKISDENRDVFIKALRGLGYTKATVKFYNHHLSHAASAYYCAPFKPDLVVTCDGIGDAETFNFYKFNKDKGLEPAYKHSYQISIGQFYSSITKMLGFRPTRHEGKITGLAAFGKESKLVEEFSKLFYRSKDNELERFPGNELDRLWKEWKLKDRLKLSGKINLQTSESDTGVDYAKRGWVLLAQLEKLTTGFSKEDIAYACQQVTENIVVDEIRRVIQKTFGNKTVKLALAGGVFANVRVNQKILEMPEVDNVFIQPAMGDSGLAQGAAILADLELRKKSWDSIEYQYKHTFWGPDYSTKVDPFIKGIGGEAAIKKMDNPAQVIAKLLMENKVIGFWHGSMEWGPRALGRRSMIINTFDRTVNDSVNKRLNRTEFMPFAPSIIDHKIKDYIPEYDPECPAADYMTITYAVDPRYHQELQAVVHVDGTARPQVVRKDSNPYYYNIIDEFYKLSGCGAIVNTSFNAHEEPIVSTPEVAYKALKENRIDVLVIEQYLIEINSAKN
ncbi:MAG: carbamoyltransferase C-terminal domain-containing protein [Bacteroidota bacterium]